MGCTTGNNGKELGQIIYQMSSQPMGSIAIVNFLIKVTGYDLWSSLSASFTFKSSAWIKFNQSGLPFGFS